MWIQSGLRGRRTALSHTYGSQPEVERRGTMEAHKQRLLDCLQQGGARDKSAQGATVIKDAGGDSRPTAQMQSPS